MRLIMKTQKMPHENKKTRKSQPIKYKTVIVNK